VRRTFAVSQRLGVILSDREIRAAMRRGAVRIDPPPAPAAWSSTAVDLTLSGPLFYWQARGGKRSRMIVAPHGPNYNFSALSEQLGQTIPLGAKGHVVEPFSFLLAWTVERIQLPHESRIAARVEGKSGVARLGLGIHVTTPTIQAGFGATGDPNYLGSSLQLEIWNIGPLRIKLEQGMPICQLIFEWVDGTPEQGYAGRLNLQGPEAETSTRSAE